MINIDEYFEVDWIATGNKLKGLLRERVSLDALAQWADRDVKTIRNWLKDPSAMGINRLLVLAKFLDMDVVDIVVTKGKLKDIRACEDIVYAEDATESAVSNLNGGRTSKRMPMCNDAQQFAKKVIYNEWSRYMDKPDEDAPIKTLREFLLYLPLFDLNELSEFVYRTMGDVCDNMGYVYDRIQCLYAKIGETDAKKYADHMKYFFLTEPDVKRMTDEDMHVFLIQEKYEEYRRYTKSSSYAREQGAYMAACQRASDRFAFIYKLKYQLDEIMRDQIDYTRI
ncbi:MAG: hypothetical protein IKT52_01870 [Oscillospiraceae bacterium]|nr:hypothetical protein [Oscillospiraceae bacterium]